MHFFHVLRYTGKNDGEFKVELVQNPIGTIQSSSYTVYIIMSRHRGLFDDSSDDGNGWCLICSGARACLALIVPCSAVSDVYMARICPPFCVLLLYLWGI